MRYYKDELPKIEFNFVLQMLFTKSWIFDDVCSLKCIATMGWESSETEISRYWKQCKREKQSTVMLKSQGSISCRNICLNLSFLLLSLPLPVHDKKLARFRSAKQRTRVGNFIRSALRTGTDLRPNPRRLRRLLEGNAVNGKSCETALPSKVNQPTNSFRNEICNHVKLFRFYIAI